MLRKLTLVVTAAAASIALAMPAAQATFAGANGRIAYSSNKGQITTMLPDGTKKQTLTSFTGGSTEAPEYSADGRWIVFDKYSGASQGLYVMRADGTHLHRIVKGGAAYAWAPSWSPDGQWIVYSSDGGGSQIKRVRADGTHAQALGTAVGEYARYSPNGNKIVYGGDDGQIHVMRADGTHDNALASGDYPDWSPDGTTIGFTSAMGGGGFDVWLMNADGSNQRQVTSKGTIGYSPVFSPDGKKLLYTDTSQLWVSRLDGTHEQPLLTVSNCCTSWQAI